MCDKTVRSLLISSVCRYCNAKVLARGCAYIICVCVSTLRRILLQYLPSLFFVPRNKQNIEVEEEPREKKRLLFLACSAARVCARSCLQCFFGGRGPNAFEPPLGSARRAGRKCSDVFLSQSLFLYLYPSLSFRFATNVWQAPLENNRV